MAAVMALGLVLWAVFSSARPLSLTTMYQNEPIGATVEFPDGRPQSGETKHVHVVVTRDEKPFDVYGSGYAIHLIVASTDFGSFLHTVNLEQDEIGIYGAEVPFATAGSYRVWVEVNNAHAEQHHGAGAGFLAYADFAVPAGSATSTPQPRVFGDEAQAGPYLVHLTHGDLKAGVESEWKLTVKDEAGKLRELLAPEPSIYVIIGPKGDVSVPTFRHGHSKPPTNGNTTTVWRETFPTPGQYLLWTTVYLAGTNANQQTEALEIPFVLTVGP